MLRGWLAIVVLLSASAHGRELIKPDPKMTYGVMCNEKDPDFVEYRYPEKIAYCIRNVSQTEKARIYDAYGVPERCRGQYTIDHFFPLALGGANHPANLWPEHKHVKATRQNLELELFDRISQGAITQAQALKIIVDAKLHPPEPKPWRCGVATSDYSDALDVETEF